MHVVVEYVRSEKPQRFDFRPFDFLALDFNDARASYRTSYAAAVSDKVIFFQRFAANVLKLIVFSAAVVVGRKQVFGVHCGNESRRAEFGQLNARGGMYPQTFRPLFVVGFIFFFVEDFRRNVTVRNDTFQVFGAEDRADAASTRRPFVADDAGVSHKVFTRGADDELFTFVGDLLLRLAGFHTPIRCRVLEFDAARRDFKINFFFAFPGDNKGVVAGAFQRHAEVTAAV